MNRVTRDGSSDSFKPLSGRRRLLILLLAVATAITVVTTLLDPPGGVRRQHLQRLDAPRCGASAAAAATDSDCVGGKSEVIPLTPSPASAATR